jgi:hypothetical protein
VEWTKHNTILHIRTASFYDVAEKRKVFHLQGQVGICNKKNSEIPSAKSTSCAATATADPLHDPPGISDEEAGLIGVPQCRFSPVTLTKHGK